MRLKQALRSAVRSRLSQLSPPFSLPRWRWFRLAVLVGIDIAILVVSYWGAFVLRLDDVTIAEHRASFISTLPWVVALHIAAFFVVGMYRQIWRYANYHSALLIAKCMAVGSFASVTASFLVARESMPPRSVPLIFFLLATSLVTLVKFAWRTWANFVAAASAPPKERCLIYGAGSAGDLLARHIIATPAFPYEPVGFIDDDRNKQGRSIQGLKILGTGKDLVHLAAEHKVSTMILAMHVAPGKVVRQIVHQCQASNIRPLIMPDMASALGDSIVQPRAVDIKDLLRRAPKSIDRGSVERLLSGATVLVTGAGGSIGSEICRQIVLCKPARLVLFDASEYNLYKIHQELEEAGIRGIEVHPVLGTVTDERAVRAVFQMFGPQFVLHAAAYKHVPLVEANPLEGVINNVLGTKRVIDAAVEFGAKRFVLISTDKAVNPANIMGATKRCCELLMQATAAARKAGTVFCAVRFGNVLGSSGSVIPRFIQQLQAGGPLTVTHREINRYFMLTEEAVGLVLQSLTMATRGEIFVLNMGESVRIYDMAEDLIRLVGKQPGIDIEIQVTGLRPGEKLFEELTLDGTEDTTRHDDVFVARTEVDEPETVLAAIDHVIRFALQSEERACLKLLKQVAGLVPQVVEDAEPADANISRLH